MGGLLRSQSKAQEDCGCGGMYPACWETVGCVFKSCGYRRALQGLTSTAVPNGVAEGGAAPASPFEAVPAWASATAGISSGVDCTGFL